MEPKSITLNCLLLSAAVVVGLEFVAKFLIAYGDVHPMAGLGLARIFQVIFLLLIVNYIEKNLASIGIIRSQLFAGIKKGIIWSLGVGLAAGLVFASLWLAGIQVSTIFLTPKLQKNIDTFLFLAVGAIIAPWVEEIFFRGILYGFFRQWGVATALVISTALFVLPHVTGASSPITQVVGGLLFAVAYEVEKNLMVPIAIHCLGNLAIFCLSLIMHS